MPFLVVQKLVLQKAMIMFFPVWFSKLSSMDLTRALSTKKDQTAESELRACAKKKKITYSEEEQNTLKENTTKSSRVSLRLIPSTLQIGFHDFFSSQITRIHDTTLCALCLQLLAELGSKLAAKLAPPHDRAAQQRLISELYESLRLGQGSYGDEGERGSTPSSKTSLHHLRFMWTFAIYVDRASIVPKKHTKKKLSDSVEPRTNCVCFGLTLTLLIVKMQCCQSN